MISVHNKQVFSQLTNLLSTDLEWDTDLVLISPAKYSKQTRVFGKCLVPRLLPCEVNATVKRGTVIESKSKKLKLASIRLKKRLR